VAKKSGFERDIDGNRRPIDTPAGMAEPESDTGRSADGGDIASTDMSSEPSSRTEDTQPRFLGGSDSRLEEDLAELKDRHLRLAAEYDNYRKRSSRERAELADRAQASFVAKLLDVLDDLDRLVASDPATPLASLREGLSAVETAFDPTLHEAVSTTPAPERSKEQVVSATFQPGYRFKGTLVRPARVQVYSEQAQR
jgi:molecular chaperone GrpE